MTIRPNPMKACMDAGRVAVSLSVNRWRSVDIAEIAKAAGYEWLFLDLEHSVLSEEAASQIAIMAQAVGVAPIARVGTGQLYQAARLLDAGMQGIVFPHVDSAEEAEAAAQATKYPPLGTRSLTGPLPHAGYRNVADPVSMAALNRETLTIAMIETKAALAAIDAIAGVPGIDALLIGTNDLAADLGVPGQIGDPRIGAAYERMGRAARAAGKYFGMGGVYDPALMLRYLQTGLQFMQGGSDIGFLMDAAKARREMIAGLMEKK